MPNEVENILLPYNPKNDGLLDSIDQMIREKKDISEILAITNEKILKENLRFTNKEVLLADNIWKKLSRRRLNRGYK